MEPQGYASVQPLDDFLLEVLCVRDYRIIIIVHHSSGTHLEGPEREGCCSWFVWLLLPPSCYWEAVWVA